MIENTDNYRRDKGKELNKREIKLKELADIAWSKTMVEFYYPPLNPPRYIFDYSHLEGFYIDPDHQWQITMNLADTPIFKDEDDYISYFHSISMHEVSHYEIIPYDGLIHAKLLKAAMKYVNQNFAPIVVNLFADLIIDKKLYKKYPNLMLWELQQIYEHVSNKYRGNLSNFSKFLFNSYEKICKVKLLPEELLSKMNILEKISDESISEIDKLKILKDESLSKEDLQKLNAYSSLSGKEKLANSVTKIILKDFEDESQWETKVSKIAKVLKNLVNDTFSIIGRGVKIDNDKTKIKGKSGISVEVPKDVVDVMDNPLENKNRDKLKENNEDDLRQKAEEFAKESNYTEFGSPANQAGILVDGNPLATWYRGLAKNLIEIKIYEEKPGGQVPVYPEVWRIGDPIEELDIVQTLLNSPVIIPNITTRKWAFKEGPGHLEEKQIPDLLIVLDSSGSMGWNYTAKTERGRGPYHTALLASFAALHYAASKGVKFSIINFSGHADICQWTTDFQKAEKILLRYQGSGTILPTKAILKQCEKAEKKALVFIITDFGIYNWSKSIKTMLSLANRGHKIVGFFIGASNIPKTKFKELHDSVTFYPVKNSKDLINLVIKEVKKYYF